MQDVALKNAEMRDPSTTHGTVITHFCVARRQGVKITLIHLPDVGIVGIIEPFANNVLYDTVYK